MTEVVKVAYSEWVAEGRGLSGGTYLGLLYIGTEISETSFARDSFKSILHSCHRARAALSGWRLSSCTAVSLAVTT